MHDAMPYLVQQNRRVGRENIDSAGWPADPILAGGKHVVVVGGGDTASDCVGTAFRQGAVKVTQLDIRPRPPQTEDKLAVWPFWATKMRTSSFRRKARFASSRWQRSNSSAKTAC